MPLFDLLFHGLINLLSWQPFDLMPNGELLRWFTLKKKEEHNVGRIREANKCQDYQDFHMSMTYYHGAQKCSSGLSIRRKIEMDIKHA